MSTPQRGGAEGTLDAFSGSGTQTDTYISITTFCIGILESAQSILSAEETGKEAGA